MKTLRVERLIVSPNRLPEIPGGNDAIRRAGEARKDQEFCSGQLEGCATTCNVVVSMFDT